MKSQIAAKLAALIGFVLPRNPHFQPKNGEIGFVWRQGVRRDRAVALELISGLASTPTGPLSADLMMDC